LKKKESRATALYGMAVELNIERMAEDGDRYACTCIGRMYRRTSYKHYSTASKIVLQSSGARLGWNGIAKQQNKAVLMRNVILERCMRMNGAF